MPGVSIVIPHYGDPAPTLGLVAALLAQDSDDLQIVVSDDCFDYGHAPRILDDLQQCVAGRFDVSVEHSTFQLESVGHATHEAPTHS